MEDCCVTSGCPPSGSQKTNVKGKCVSCGATARPVARQTLLHQLKHSELMTLEDISFHFCANADCDVVYFGEDGTTYKQDQIRQKVGQKSTDPGRTVCYCFDVTASKVQEELKEGGKSQSKEFVMEQVKQKLCACEIRNPAGSCCLKDFPKS